MKQSTVIKVQFKNGNDYRELWDTLLSGGLNHINDGWGYSFYDTTMEAAYYVQGEGYQEVQDLVNVLSRLAITGYTLNIGVTKNQ